MKKIWLFLFMLVIPLQAVLAAVETYHGHGSEHESVIESVFHSHNGHEHSKEVIDNTLQGTSCDGDHHHCHAHSVSVLPGLFYFEAAPAALSQAPERFNGFNSFLSNRIERPKWI